MNKKAFLGLILSVLLCLTAIFSSCTTAYFPNELNTPAFHNSNEFYGGISYGSSGLNLQTGYSFYKNLGVTADLSYLSVKGNERHFQRNLGFGLGYFNKLHKDDNVYFEVLAGFNTITTHSSYEDQNFAIGPGHENSRYYRLYIQPDMSFNYKYIDLIFAARISYFNFTSYNRHDEPSSVLPRAFGIEPAATIKLGTEYVKFKTQVGFALIGNLSGSRFNYDKVFIHFGLEVGF
jgi:hypothetical protein